MTPRRMTEMTKDPKSADSVISVMRLADLEPRIMTKGHETGTVRPTTMTWPGPERLLIHSSREVTVYGHGMALTGSSFEGSLTEQTRTHRGHDRKSVRR